MIDYIDIDTDTRPKRHGRRRRHKEDIKSRFGQKPPINIKTKYRTNSRPRWQIPQSLNLKAIAFVHCWYRK